MNENLNTDDIDKQTEDRLRNRGGEEGGGGGGGGGSDLAPPIGPASTPSSGVDPNLGVKTIKSDSDGMKDFGRTPDGETDDEDYETIDEGKYLAERRGL